MKKIPSSVPVFIQDLQSEPNSRYSTAKLKVFYEGETGDHRLFTKEFSEKLIKTLPSTPVVGYYSEEDEDFVGHNRIQYVYGHVPETASIEFQEDKEYGRTYAVTDVILYTERKDNIGEVAKKIVGKQHSLELDPDTLEYKINRDKNGHLINIEFINGSFIGLSVLGDNETPAFLGSGFFTLDKSYEEFAAISKQNFEKFLQYLNNNGGEIQVFNQEEYFQQLCDFLVKETHQEFEQKMYEILAEKGCYGYIVESSNDYVVFAQYDEVQCKILYLRYTVEQLEDGYNLINPVPVRARYLTEEEIANSSKEDFVDNSEAKKEDKEESQCIKEDEEKDKCVTKDDEDKPKINEAAKPDEDEKGKCIDDKQKQKEEGVSDDQQKTKQEKRQEEPNNKYSSSALSEEERQELEQYRRQEKLSIIDSYDKELSDSTLEQFKSKVDELSKSELEAQLAIEFRKTVKQQVVNTKFTKSYQPFSVIAPIESYDETDSAAAIKKYNN